MANQDLPTTADLDYRKYVLDLLKVVFIAVVPPVIMLLGAVVAVDAAHNLNNTIAKIKEPIDEAMIAELKEKLQRFLLLWPLIPGLQLVVATFAFVAGSVSERVVDIAGLSYLAGLFASIAAYTLYEPYFALFTRFWRWLTEVTYLGSAVVVYLNAYGNLIRK